MRAHEFLFEQSITDQDAQMFLLGLLSNSYSIKLPQLPMKSILKSMLDQGYLRDAKWVLNVINNLPDDDNLIVNKQASDNNQVVFVQDEQPAEEPQPEQPEAEQVVDRMAKSALDKRMK